MSKQARRQARVAFPTLESEREHQGYLATLSNWEAKIAVGLQETIDGVLKQAGRPKYLAFSPNGLLALATRMFIAGALYAKANPKEIPDVAP
jgi:hypothetical protein